MKDKPTLRELVEVQEHFRLPSPALVEKDWYVVRALRALANADTGQFQLVFGGGTALSRAHRLVRRMSEDIDLKIVSSSPFTRTSLRNLREAVTAALRSAGFTFDPGNPHHRESGNESRYTLYRLPYTPIAEGAGSLRPEIQIETAVWPLRTAGVSLPVTSFVAEAFGRSGEIASITCVSLAETVAEKFVALTRRAGAEFAGAGGPRDPTLVRHVYDLHAISPHYDPDEVIALARTIIPADADAYGHQFPAYRENPRREVKRAIAAMTADAEFVRRYAVFVRDMVYGDHVDFEIAIATVAALGKLL